MSACPPKPAQTQFDMRNANDCVTMLRMLWQAYTACITGNQRILVRFNERWSEYQKANANEIREHYMLVYAQCPYAKDAGLPDLNPGAAVRRGAPSHSRRFFPRM